MKTKWIEGHGLMASMDHVDVLEKSHSELLECLQRLRSAFVVAVGDKSPFAKMALGDVDEVIAKAKSI